MDGQGYGSGQFVWRGERRQVGHQINFQTYTVYFWFNKAVSVGTNTENKFTIKVNENCANGQ